MFYNVCSANIIHSMKQVIYQWKLSHWYIPHKNNRIKKTPVPELTKLILDNRSR